MNLTSIVNKLYFQPRHRELERYTHGGEAIQDEILRYLVEQGKDTEYGRNHLFLLFIHMTTSRRTFPSTPMRNSSPISTECVMVSTMFCGRDR